MENILIAFVTTSDPRTEKRGIAQTLTAARALEPRVIHLLYTETTAGNCEATATALREFPALAQASIVVHKVDLPDARDLAAALRIVRSTLPQIRRHSWGLFHLVSGHPEVRLAMALCVAVGDIGGVVHWVDDPRDKSETSRESCTRRLKEIDINVIRQFLRDSYQQRLDARLRIGIQEHRATLDGVSLPVRARGAGGRSAAWEILVVLAARRMYCGGEAPLTLGDLSQAGYGTRTKAVNVRKRIDAMNDAAAKATRKTPSPIRSLIVCASERGGYLLSPDLRPTDIVVAETEDELREHLDELAIGDVRSLFPSL